MGGKCLVQRMARADVCSTRACDRHRDNHPIIQGRECSRGAVWVEMPGRVTVRASSFSGAPTACCSCKPVVATMTQEQLLEWFSRRDGPL
jgi:hypothetical protein